MASMGMCIVTFLYVLLDTVDIFSFAFYGDDLSPFDAEILADVNAAKCQLS